MKHKQLRLFDLKQIPIVVPCLRTTLKRLQAKLEQEQIDIFGQRTCGYCRYCDECRPEWIDDPLACAKSQRALERKKT